MVVTFVISQKHFFELLKKSVYSSYIGQNCVCERQVFNVLLNLKKKINARDKIRT